MIRIFLILPLLLGIISCSVGPDYAPPHVNVPEGWKNSTNASTVNYEFSEDGEVVYLDHWWDVFGDEKLNALEEQAIVNNRNLYVAYERVLESRALMKAAAANFYPQLTLDPQYTNTGELIELFGGSGISGVVSTAIKRFVRAHELLYFLPLNLSYEVDLWGKIRDIYNSAKYHYAAEIKDYEFVMLTLTTDLATAYYQLRAADKQLDLLAATLKTRQKAFEINQDRYDEQVIFYSDVTLAGEEVSSVIAEQEEVLRQRNLLEDQIAVLVGENAPDFTLEHMPLQNDPPCIPAGIPSEILTRRPDILEAELNMRSQHALVKEAYSEFFPSLTLTASGGFLSPVLKFFLKRFSRYWMVGASSNQVMFDGGRLESNLERQIAAFQEASGTYQQQVLTAFQEVEDALSDINYYKQQYDATGITVEWAEKSYQLYQDRYAFGLTYYIDVVNTERDLLGYQVSLNSLLGLRYISTIQFIKALGGSWSIQSPVCDGPAS